MLGVVVDMTKAAHGDIEVSNKPNRLDGIDGEIGQAQPIPTEEGPVDAGEGPVDAVRGGGAGGGDCGLVGPRGGER